MQFVINQVGEQTGLSVTTGAAVALALPTAGLIKPTHAIIQVVSNSIRYTCFGTAPTSTIGLLVVAGSNIEFMEPDFNYNSFLAQFRAIGISGTATLEIAYYGA